MKDAYIRTVRATRFVDCPFSAVIEFAEEALRQRREITVSPALPIGERVRLSTQITNDISDRARRHDALLLAWRPRFTRLFPGFRGALTVRPKDRGAWLRIQGSYEPPFGAAGRVFDEIAGRFIARLTLERLLLDLAENIEQRWRSTKAELSA